MNRSTTPTGSSPPEHPTLPWASLLQSRYSRGPAPSAAPIGVLLALRGSPRPVWPTGSPCPLPSGKFLSPELASLTQSEPLARNSLMCFAGLLCSSVCLLFSPTAGLSWLLED